MTCPALGWFDGLRDGGIAAELSPRTVLTG